MAIRAARKITVLMSCTFLGLICGTLYLYSSYGPQLAQKLDYTVTESSTIALSGTIGVAIAGPLAGFVIDRKGYTKSLVLGGMAIVFGYQGLKYQFDAKKSLLVTSCELLALVGMGSTFLNSTCLKCCAVSFPSIRGVATSLPLALYGLSALFYSATASIFFLGNTSSFLGFLSGSSFFIFLLCAPSIMYCDIEPLTRKPHQRGMSDSFDMSAPGTPTSERHLSKKSEYHKFEDTMQEADTGGVQLLYSYKFWLIFVLTGSLASLGQMYIYSVGYMIKALVYRALSQQDVTEVDTMEALIQQRQQFQVGLISIANCIGRIAAGILGDVISQSFGKSRSYLIFLPTIGFFFTQVLALLVDNEVGLRTVSLLTGLNYGFIFCIMPIIVGDAFGMNKFSSNWGIVGLAPIFPSYFFTLLFGNIYDKNSQYNELHGARVCLHGNGCYSSIFHLTLGVTITSFILTCILNSGFSQRPSMYKAKKPAS